MNDRFIFTLNLDQIENDVVKVASIQNEKDFNMERTNGVDIIQVSDLQHQSSSFYI